MRWIAPNDDDETDEGNHEDDLEKPEKVNPHPHEKEFLPEPFR